MKLNWTHKAQKDLVEIARYIKRYNHEAARRLLLNIRMKVFLLQDNLFLGRKVPEAADKTIRELLYKNYRIVYRIKPESIEIITVFEGHKLLDKDSLG